MPRLLNKGRKTNMEKTQTLCFQVDGEWLTKFARDWFWLENRPYDVCRNLICSCLQAFPEDKQTEIANQILEGRKKFVGINNFQLVDDNECIRPLSDKIVWSALLSPKVLSPERETVRSRPLA